MEEDCSERVSFTVKLPRKVFEELMLRVPKRSRSEFVCDAVEEKLHRNPASVRLDDVEEKIRRLEDDVGQVKKLLIEFDLLSYGKGKVDPYSYCQDEIDRKIVEFLNQRGGATTPEIAKNVGENRWLILNRLKRIAERSERKLGKPVVHFLTVERRGKKRAWWMDESILT